MAQPDMKRFPDSVFRIVVLGKEGCGKTSLINKYVSGNGDGVFAPTHMDNR